MFLSMLQIIILSQLSYAYDLTSLIYVTPKYDTATKTAIQAAYKQSGYEDKANTVKEVSTAKGFKFIKDNGLSSVVAIGSAIVPVILNKKIDIHTGNFVLSGSSDKKEVDWMFHF